MNWQMFMVSVGIVLICSTTWGHDVAALYEHASEDEEQTREDRIAVEQTAAGPLVVEPINHSALRFEFGGKQYYVDPAGRAEWGAMPKADVILITHEHRDHLTLDVIEQLKTEKTIIYMNKSSAEKASLGEVIEVGQTMDILGVKVEAIPAYNMHPDRMKYHPKARKDNGYVLTFGGKRVYVAGDTEGIPEMKALKKIDIAFLPINLPYTMPPDEAAEAAKAFQPRVLYPYHQGKSDPNEVKELLKEEEGIEVRVLRLP